MATKYKFICRVFYNSVIDKTIYKQFEVCKCKDKCKFEHNNKKYNIKKLLNLKFDLSRPFHL